jgi:site-specific DNA-cytosine methylase
MQSGDYATLQKSVPPPHKRPRIYLVAYPRSIRQEGHESIFSCLQKEVKPESRTIRGTTVEVNVAGRWLDQSPVPFLGDGLPPNMARRFSAVGNAVVPPLVPEIFKTIELYEMIYG